MSIFTRRALSVSLAIIFALSMFGATAFADWPSFQNNVNNNGVIPSDVATPPPTTTPSTISGKLPTNGSAYVGVDTTSVIVGDIAYTLYNGGATNGTSGGARLSALNLVNGQLVWGGTTIQIEPKADNVQQLSTPYYDEIYEAIYAATTYYQNHLVSDGLKGWIGPNGQIPTPYTFQSSQSPVTIVYNGLNIPSDYWEPQLVTDITASSGTISGAVTLTNTGTGASYSFGSNTFYPGYGPWTLYNNSGTMIPKGNYRLSLTVTTNTNLSVSSLKFLLSEWSLYRVTDLGDQPPPIEYLAGGYGQANTPIGYDYAGGNIYFGIYEGDRCYYQYAMGYYYPPLTAYRPEGGDDFYWAGATVWEDGYVVFGGDKGRIYVRPIDSFASGAGNVITLPDPGGKVRSSVVSWLDSSSIPYVFFTSRISDGSGELWSIEGNLFSSAADIDKTPVAPGLSQTSVSTPVISDNDVLYVGASWYDSTMYESAGGVGVLDPTDIENGGYTVYLGDPVQSSPIVWTNPNTGDDYVYFTTNTGAGKGYCYSYAPWASAGVFRWFAGGTSGNPYALQGFAASDNGYLVYGDDDNYLYVMH